MQQDLNLNQFMQLLKKLNEAFFKCLVHKFVLVY